VVFIYIKYTKEQKDLARSSNVADVLLRLGETVSTCGKEYVWESPQGLVTLHNNVWFNHYQQKGGDVIDFLKEFYDKNYIEALEFLLSEKINVCEKVEKPKQKTEFQIPKFSSSMKRVYGYLIKTRGIDSEIVNEFAKQGMIKESKDFHNALFIGYDNENNIKHIHQRGTYPGNSFKNNIEQIEKGGIELNILNCFAFEERQEINKILSSHDYILKTSGIEEIIGEEELLKAN
jgi:hypothetical protein